jgi:hypothetical protein
MARAAIHDAEAGKVEIPTREAVAFVKEEEGAGGIEGMARTAGSNCAQVCAWEVIRGKFAQGKMPRQQCVSALKSR